MKKKNGAIQDIIDKIDGGKSDTISKKISLGSVTYPLMLGINLYADLYIQAQATFQIKTEYKQEIEINEIVGMQMTEDGAVPYNSIQISKNTYEFSVLGKINSKLGAGVNFGVYLLSKDLFKVNFNLELGAYADTFIIYDTKITQNTKVNKDTYIGGKIEMGVYYTVSGKASFNIFFYSENIELMSQEEKMPLLTIGDNELIKGIYAEHKEYQIENQKISVPVIKKRVWNISEDKITDEEIDVSSLKFMTENKKELSVSNGKINLPSDTDMTIVIQYTGKNISAQTKIKALHTLSQTANQTTVASNSWDALNEFVKKHISDEAKASTAHCYSSYNSTFSDVLSNVASMNSFPNISGMETFFDNSLLVVNLYENNDKLVEVVMAGYIDETTLRNVYSQNEAELKAEGFGSYYAFKESFLALFDTEIGSADDSYLREGYYFMLSMLGEDVNLSNFASMLGKEESQVKVEDIAKLFGEQFKISMYQMY